jgi:hypothetical protein
MTELRSKHGKPSLPSSRGGGGNSEAAIWARLIQPERDDLTGEAARSILRIRFGEEDRKLIHELLVKNQQGALSSEERVELENFRRAGYLLDLMHSKARRSLKKLSAPALHE